MKIVLFFAVLAVTGRFGVGTLAAPGGGTGHDERPAHHDAHVRSQATDQGPARKWTRQLECACEAIGIAVAVDGAVYVAGSSSSGFAGVRVRGRNDMLLAKYDASGNFLWGRLFGFAGSDVAGGLALGADGSVYVSGWTDHAPETAGGTAGFRPIVGAVLLKYRPDGHRSWARFLTDELGTGADYYGHDVAVGRDGGIYLAAEGPAVIARYEPSGERTWVRFLTEPGSESYSAAEAVTTYENAIYALGYHGRGRLLAKLAPDGHVLWVREFKGGDSIIENAGIVGSGGSIYVFGQTQFTEVTTLTRYSLQGRQVWARNLPGTDLAGFGRIGSVAAGRDGTVWLTCQTKKVVLDGERNHGKLDIVLAQYDKAGARLGLSLHGGRADDEMAAVTVARDGSILVAGNTRDHIVVFKLAPQV